MIYQLQIRTDHEVQTIFFEARVLAQNITCHANSLRSCCQRYGISEDSGNEKKIEFQNFTGGKNSESSEMLREQIDSSCMLKMA